MAFQNLPPVRVLPGGRKVRDYSGLTVETLKAAVKDDPDAAVTALLQEEEKAKPRKTAIEALEKEAAKADSSEGAAREDESLG